MGRPGQGGLVQRDAPPCRRRKVRSAPFPCTAKTAPAPLHPKGTSAPTPWAWALLLSPPCGARRDPLSVLPKEKRAVHGPKRKAPGCALVQWPSALKGGGESVPAPIWPCLRARQALLQFPRLPSRGGWCGSCRDARTHLNCFSFPVSRYGAPGISVISVPLVPPSARSASLRAALAVMEAAAWPYAETLINHRPAAAKISAACIPDFPGLEGLPRAGRFPL